MLLKSLRFPQWFFTTYKNVFYLWLLVLETSIYTTIMAVPLLTLT